MAVAMSKYEIHFENGTDSAYHFGVYQDCPTSPELKSVVWQVRRLPPHSANKVTWSMNYGVAIVDWDENDGDYSGLQIVPAQLGNTYQVIVQNRDIPAIDPNPVSAGYSTSENRDQIKLFNKTPQNVKIGFAINGSLIARTESGRVQRAHYTMSSQPTFYVALYHYVKHGDLADRNIQVEPVKIEFTDGNTKALVKCHTENGREMLQTGALWTDEDDREIFEASRTEVIQVRTEKFKAFQSGKSVHHTAEENVIIRSIKQLQLLLPAYHKDTQTDSEDDEH